MQHGRLARAGRSHDRGELAGVEIRRDLVERATAAAPVPWTFTPLTMRAADATSIVKVACSLRMVMFIGPAFLATVPTEPRQVPALSCLCPHRPGHRIITTRPPIKLAVAEC